MSLVKHYPGRPYGALPWEKLEPSVVHEISNAIPNIINRCTSGSSFLLHAGLRDIKDWLKVERRIEIEIEKRRLGNLVLRRYEISCQDSITRGPWVQSDNDSLLIDAILFSLN